MALYNLILQDTIIEDIPLDKAMDIAQMYAEVEAQDKRKIRRFNFLPIGYEYRVAQNDELITVATIELSE